MNRMETNPYYLLIEVSTRTEQAPSEQSLRQSLASTFEALGGVTRAVVHFDVLSIAISASDSSEQLFEVWMRLHKE